MYNLKVLLMNKTSVYKAMITSTNKQRVKSLLALCILIFSTLSSLCYANPSLSATGMCQRVVTGKVDYLELRDQRLAAVVEMRETPFDSQKERGHTAVWVLPKITNLSKESVSVTVSCAFFDQKGLLVVALSQGWHQLDPEEKNFQLSSCIQRLPVADFQRIHSCMVSILVGTPRKPSYDLEEDDASDE